MNSIPGREPRADTLDINQPKETHKRGCYLALTFGTLLSSQGADAQRNRPLRASSLADVLPYPASDEPPQRELPGWPPGPRGASRTIHDLGGPCTGGPPAA